MGKRILLAGLAGGVLVFIVSGILHSSRKLAEVGIRAIPNEDLVLLAMRNSIPEAGFYYFPAPNLSPMYKPGGEDSNFGKLLATQFLIGLAAAFIAAWILGATASGTTYGMRVIIIVLIGLFAEIYIVLPYWNWYGFPTDYAIGHVIGGVVSWAVAGLAMAAIVKRPAAQQSV